MMDDIVIPERLGRIEERIIALDDRIGRFIERHDLAEGETEKRIRCVELAIGNLSVRMALITFVSSAIFLALIGAVVKLLLKV